MAVSVIMPRQGQSVESCILTEWKKKVGDQVKVGDILFAYETDKASFEEEAKVDGTLLAVFYNEQDDIPCLEEVAVIGNPGEDISGFGKKGAEAPAQEAPKEAAAPAPAPQAPAAVERSKDATAVIMPRQGQSVESCILTEWKKKVGDEVKVGDILFSYETDKASFEEEAKVEGTLLAVFFNEQDDIPCLEEVAVIGKPGTSVAGFGPKAAQEAAAPAQEAPKEATAPAQAEEAPKAEATGPACGISPRARNAAARLGVDLSTVVATGPHGRILERDVMAAKKATAGALLEGTAAGIQGTGIGGRVTLSDIAAAKAAPAAEAPKAAEAAPAAAPQAPAADYEDEKIPNIRKAIAKNMCNSLSTMAQLTLNTSFDATEIVKYRALLKASEDEAIAKITYNDFMIFAVSRIVKKYRNLNANWLDKEGVIRHFNHVHIGMAVDTPKGLFVPTIFNADQKTLAQISAEAKALAADAKAGKLSPDKMSGASITISNVGAFGIESFTPVINPPQTAILGVCGMEDKVRAGKDGQIELYKAMGLSLTIDHRALDGADGSRFLKELCAAMKNFSVLLAQ